MSKIYIGYMTGDKGVLYPDVFSGDSRTFDTYIGKPWGSYVSVAGPFDSVREARATLKAAGSHMSGMASDRARTA